MSAGTRQSKSSMSCSRVSSKPWCGMLCDTLAALTKCSDETRPHDAAEVSSIGAQKSQGGGTAVGAPMATGGCPVGRGLPARSSLKVDVSPV